MDATLWLKLLHVLTAIWFIAGLLGRWVALAQAARAPEVGAVEALAGLAGRFDRAMVIPGSIAVLVAGLLAAWARGYPVLGALQGASANWLLVSLILYLSVSVLVPTVFLPRGRIFDHALSEARERGTVTPELRAAFADPVVTTAHAYELAVVFVVVVLMVTKPF
jgi:uncharacterized membrane protein